MHSNSVVSLAYVIKFASHIMRNAREASSAPLFVATEVGWFGGVGRGHFHVRNKLRIEVGERIILRVVVTIVIRQHQIFESKLEVTLRTSRCFKFCLPNFEILPKEDGTKDKLLSPAAIRLPRFNDTRHAALATLLPNCEQTQWRTTRTSIRSRL